MTVFYVIEKQQKSRFCLQFFFLLNSSLQTQKSTFTAKFSPSPSLEVILFALFIAGAELQPLILVHTGLASIFNIATALHAGKWPEFWAAFVPSPIYFIFILSPQPLRPTTEISRLLCCSVVANSKICRGRSRKSSVVESQGYFVLERPFLQFHEQRAKFANEVNHLTRFFEKVDS